MYLAGAARNAPRDHARSRDGGLGQRPRYRRLAPASAQAGSGQERASPCAAGDEAVSGCAVRADPTYRLPRRSFKTLSSCSANSSVGLPRIPMQGRLAGRRPCCGQHGVQRADDGTAEFRAAAALASLGWAPRLAPAELTRTNAGGQWRRGSGGPPAPPSRVGSSCTAAVGSYGGTRRAGRPDYRLQTAPEVGSGNQERTRGVGIWRLGSESD